MKHVARGIDPDSSMFGQLRQLLDETERQIVIMPDSPNGARTVIANVDLLDGLASTLKRPQVDMRAEQNRLEALHGRLLRDASAVAKLVQRGGDADALARSPTWQAVQTIAAELQRKQRRRWIITGAAVVVVAVLLFVVLPWIFPPTPQVNTTAIAQAAANSGDASALTLANAERARVPNDPQGALWVGALYLKQGNSTAANTAWDAARKLYNNDDEFYFNRASVLLQIGEYDQATADAQQLIASPDHAAFGYYVRGEIEEERGQTQQALQDYQQAATLADQINNAQLAVTVRTRMGYLMQRPNVPTDPPAP